MWFPDGLVVTKPRTDSDHAVTRSQGIIGRDTSRWPAMRLPDAGRSWRY
jgi:hypothetical protein